MNQSRRNRTIDKLRRGDVRVLVATDVAARGIDVANITHVINYDLPKAAEDYIHRIGRTGRAGATGIAISFAAPDDMRPLQQIERYTGQSIKRHVIVGFEPQLKPMSANENSRRYGEQRKSHRGFGNGPRSDQGRWNKSLSGNEKRTGRDLGRPGR
jgi:superfamily II DNA/RNA helicase